MTHHSLAGQDCQHLVIDEFLCMVSGCASETDVCHWMFKTKVSMVQAQEDAILTTATFPLLWSKGSSDFMGMSWLKNYFHFYSLWHISPSHPLQLEYVLHPCVDLHKCYISCSAY